MSQALICFLNVHVLFSHKSTAPAAKAMPLEMEDHLQHKLRGVFEVSAERFAEELSDSQNSKLLMFRPLTVLTSCRR